MGTGARDCVRRGDWQHANSKTIDWALRDGPDGRPGRVAPVASKPPVRPGPAVVGSDGRRAPKNDAKIFR